MNYRKLGGANLKVSEIGLGTFSFGGPPKQWPRHIGWDGVGDNVSLKILDACVDLGINFIDTADIYGNGHSEELIGEACEFSDYINAKFLINLSDARIFQII